MTWQTIASMRSLLAELDEQFPGRVKPDWIIGDEDHSSRVSDHNPAPDGDVHAVDIRLGGDLDPRKILNAIVGDHRLKYVIFNHKIYSRTYGWEARAYKGSNPHTTHIHVSFRYGDKFEDDTSRWFEPEKRRTRPVPIDLSVVRNEFLKAIDQRPGDVDARPHVRRLQRALKVEGLYDGEIDGLVGRRTLNAWGDWETQRDVPGAGRPRIPDRKSLAALLQARWRMVA